MQTDTPQTKELLRKYMRKNGYRFSVDRFRLVDRLLELSGEISVPDFFEYLCSRKDFFAISTIYRNFIFFEKSGLITSSGENTGRYLITPEKLQED